MSKSRAKNTSWNDDILTLAEGWCKANGLDFSSVAENLFRDFLRTKGMPVDAPLDEVLRYAKAERDKQTAKKKKAAKRTA